MAKPELTHFGIFQSHPIRRLEDRSSLQQPNLASFTQGEKPVGKFIDHLILPATHSTEINLRFAEVYPHLSGALGVVQKLRQKKKRFGGDTPAKQALPTRPFLQVYQGDVHSQIRRPKRSHIAARSCADDEKLSLVSYLCHVVISPFSLTLARILSESPLPCMICVLYP